MKRTLWAIAIVGLFLVALALTVRAQTSLRILPDQSIGVLSQPPTSGEHWSTSVLPFGNYTGTVSGEAVFCRTYLHFPLDGIPAGSTIQSATLYIYVDDFWPGPGGAPMSAYPVESGAGWPAGDEWNDVGNWPALGGAAATTNVSSTSGGGWFSWDVTPLAQGWLGGTPNDGLAVAAANLDSTASNWAAARRLSAGDPDTRPYLEVILSEPAPTSTPTSTPTATSQPPPPPSTATPQPSAPPATPVPTSTPEPVLLPVTGGDLPSPAVWPPLIGGGLGLLAGVAMIVSRKALLR